VLLPASALGGSRPTAALPGSAVAGFRPSASPMPSAGTIMRSSPEEIIGALRKGGALYAAKRFQEAEEVARLILRFEPRQADALHLLGLVKHGQGASAEAERLIAKAIAVARPHPNLFVNLGNAQRQQGKSEAALVSYGRAIGLDATYADAYEARAEVLGQVYRFDEAMADMQTLIGLRPVEILPYLKAASTANDAGLFRQALHFCDAALNVFDPPPVELLTMIAVSHERLSELEETVLWAEKALAREPRNGNALRVWAKARRRLAKRNTERLRAVRARLVDSDPESMSVPEARVIYAELANVSDELEEVDRAFNYFTLQNEKTLEFVRQGGQANEDFLKDVERLIDFFTPQFVEGWRSLVAPSEDGTRRAAPVFLVGFPRSGTTLLDQILDAHPDVQVIEERPLLRSLKISVDAMRDEYPRGLVRLSVEQRRELRERYRSEVVKQGFDPADRIVVDKMPLNLVHIGLVNRIFPEAKIILALRHPADVVLSCFMQDFIPNGAMANFLTLDGTARLYDRVMTLWQRYREVLPLNVVEVRYENLIRDLRGEVEPVLNFLGLEWNEAQADPAAHALARGTIRTPSYAQVTQPIYSSAADRWRRYDKYLAPVMPLLEKHIRYFGYSL
jgi:tetratricopeptide (TPR) repeat protein